MEPIRVLIAEDNPRFRDGVVALLRSTSSFEVAREVATGEEAITRARAVQPDVVLMDLRMPGIDGIEATRRIVQDSPHIAVLALTMLEDDDSVFAALRAGARGYLLKGALKAEILRAIQDVASGEAIFGPAIARRLMQYCSAARPRGLGHAFPDLTEREGEILILIAQGRTGALALLAFGGALGGTLMVLLSNTVIATTSVVADSGTEPGVVRTLDTLIRMLTTFDDPPWALGYAAASLALLQIRAVPAWLGGLGLIAASLLLVHAAAGPGAAAPNPLPSVLGLLGFALSLFWVLAISSVLTWRSRLQRMGSRAASAGVY